MKRRTIPEVVVAATIWLLAVSPARAHDMSSMEHDLATNASGAMGQMGRHMEMGAHMRMTAPRPSNPGDQARAEQVLHTLRDGISKYKDVRLALADGYRPFIPQVPLEIYHFTNYSLAYQEYTGHFDAAHPASLLYEKTGPNSFNLTGAMYSAPASYSENDLDQMIPLSIASWHSHTDICLPKGITLNDLIRGNIGADRDDMPGELPVSSPGAQQINRTYGFLADGRFGFAGKIHTAAECQAAGGHFMNQAWGWMVHVYPFGSDDVKVAFSQDAPRIFGMHH